MTELEAEISALKERLTENAGKFRQAQPLIRACLPAEIVRFLPLSAYAPIAQALQQAEQRGYQRGLEAAAKVAHQEYTNGVEDGQSRLSTDAAWCIENTIRALMETPQETP